MSEALCKRFPLGVVSFFALLLQRAEEAKRSPNWMANCPMAAVHSMGLRQCIFAFLMARYRSLNAASSVGKLPRVLMIPVQAGDKLSVKSGSAPRPRSWCRSSCGSKAQTRRTGSHAPKPCARPLRSPDSACPIRLRTPQAGQGPDRRFPPDKWLDPRHDRLAIFPEPAPGLNGGDEGEAVPD
jgi:hypothetical protein